MNAQETHASVSGQISRKRHYQGPLNVIKIATGGWRNIHNGRTTEAKAQDCKTVHFRELNMVKSLARVFPRG